MKRILAVLLALCMVLAFAGCGAKDEENENQTQQDAGYDDEYIDDDEDYDEDYDEDDDEQENNNYTPVPDTHIVSICRSFNATGCAQITNLTYDEYGYPNGGQYTCYCQACGKDLGGGGFGFTGAHGSKHCNDCDQWWQYGIEANTDTIEVED